MSERIKEKELRTFTRGNADAAGAPGIQSEDSDDFSQLRSQLREKPRAEAEAETPKAVSTEGGFKSSGSGTGNVPFKLVSVADTEWDSFAASWRPSMQTPTYIGETQMLLQYLAQLEELYHVTMPIKACGIDPVVFENVEMFQVPDTEETADAPTAGFNNAATKVFRIPRDTGDEGEDAPAENSYELIRVDGDLYMSCVSCVLDPAYMNSVIAAVTSAVKEYGVYVFQLVGYRQLALVEGEKEGRLLNTLKLNTYEMSLLCSYMMKFKDMDISFGHQSGKQCIRFSVKQK